MPGKPHLCVCVCVCVYVRACTHMAVGMFVCLLVCVSVIFVLNSMAAIISISKVTSHIALLV